METAHSAGVMKGPGEPKSPPFNPVLGALGRRPRGARKFASFARNCAWLLEISGQWVYRVL